MPPVISQNRILAACAADATALLAQLEQVALAPGAVLERPDQGEHYVWFIESGLASLSVRLDGNAEMEPLQIGPEGFCGFSAILGSAVLTYSTIMRIGGSALRIDGERLRSFLRERPAFRERLLRSIHAAQRRLTQETHCVGRHALADRLASRLLALSAQLGGDTIPMTHDALASMLGSRRVAVTTAMRSLQQAGLVSQQWGSLSLPDKAALAERSCGCHVADVPQARQPIAAPVLRQRAPVRPALGGGGRLPSGEAAMHGSRGQNKA